jgi:hypothetical protein
MMIDPFRITVALLPLGVYLLLLALVNLSRRPLLTTGGRDLAAMATAVVGLIAVGPLELFMPQMAAMKFGGYIWLPLIAFYGLWVSLLVLLARPRLVNYNISLDELRPILTDVVAGIDPEARWAGDTLVLTQPRQPEDESDQQPRIAQMHIDVSPAMRHIALVANGPRQSFGLWQQLEVSLAQSLREMRVRPNAFGWCLLTTAVLLGVACMTYMLGNPPAVAQGMQEMLAP